MGKKEGGRSGRGCFGGEKIGTQVSLFEPRESIVWKFQTALGPCPGMVGTSHPGRPQDTEDRDR